MSRAFIIVEPGQVADRSEVDVDIGLRAGLVETDGPVPTFASAGLKELHAMVMRYDRKRNVDRAMVLTLSTEALLASVIKRETHRLTLARDAA